MRDISFSISSCLRAVSPFKELRTLRFAAVVGPHGQSFGTIYIEMQMQNKTRDEIYSGCLRKRRKPTIVAFLRDRYQ